MRFPSVFAVLLALAGVAAANPASAETVLTRTVSVFPAPGSISSTPSAEQYRYRYRYHYRPSYRAYRWRSRYTHYRPRYRAYRYYRPRYRVVYRHRRHWRR